MCSRAIKDYSAFKLLCNCDVQDVLELYFCWLDEKLFHTLS